MFYILDNTHRLWTAEVAESSLVGTKVGITSSQTGNVTATVSLSMSSAGQVTFEPRTTNTFQESGYMYNISCALEDAAGHAYTMQFSGHVNPAPVCIFCSDSSTDVPDQRSERSRTRRWKQTGGRSIKIGRRASPPTCLASSMPRRRSPRGRSLGDTSRTAVGPRRRRCVRSGRRRHCRGRRRHSRSYDALTGSWGAQRWGASRRTSGRPEPGELAPGTPSRTHLRGDPSGRLAPHARVEANPPLHAHIATVWLEPGPQLDAPIPH